MTVTNTRSALTKVRLLLSVLRRDPAEFVERCRTLWEVQLDRVVAARATYEIASWDAVTEGLGRCFSASPTAILQEPALGQLEHALRQEMARVQGAGPFTPVHSADLALGRLCYLACRMLKPKVALETGVAYGVTTAFILQALEANGHGLLHSIDFEPLGANGRDFVGALVPKNLTHRWRLHRGVSRRVLPRLLPQLEGLGLFVHDSLHTHKNILAELRLVLPHLSRPCTVIADDVEGNAAFHEWVSEHRPRFSAVGEQVEKKSLFGVAAFD